MTIPLINYYHLFSSGLWGGPWNEHITALIDSGLYEQLDLIKIGVVGGLTSRQVAIETVKKYDKVEIIAEKDSGWEQQTLGVLQSDIINIDYAAYVLYCHTKGAANHRHDQDNWRREMTQGVVLGWRECVDLLDQYDVVGCRWRRDPWRHLSGNFWWATSSYLSTLAPISYAYRDDAEAWIGQSSRGGTHVEIDSGGNVIGIHSFGRTFVCKRDESGYSSSNLPDIGQPLLGDEFVGFSPMVGNRILTCLIMKGAKCSMIGNTIIVESVKTPNLL